MQKNELHIIATNKNGAIQTTSMEASEMSCGKFIRDNILVSTLTGGQLLQFPIYK